MTDRIGSVLHHPETILHNGNIRIVDETSRVVEAIAIRDGRILAVGDTADMRDLAGPRYAGYSSS